MQLCVKQTYRRTLGNTSLINSNELVKPGLSIELIVYFCAILSHNDLIKLIYNENY